MWDVDKWFGTVIQTTSWISTDAIGHALAMHLTINIATISGGSGTLAQFDFSFFDQALFDASLDTTSISLQVNAFNSILELGGFV